MTVLNEAKEGEKEVQCIACGQRLLRVSYFELNDESIVCNEGIQKLTSEGKTLNKEFYDKKLSIYCSEGHHICLDCIPTYVKIIMEEPTLQIPMRCLDCGGDLHNLDLIERSLSDCQLTTYLSCVLLPMDNNDEDHTNMDTKDSKNPNETQYSNSLCKKIRKDEVKVNDDSAIRTVFTEEELKEYDNMEFYYDSRISALSSLNEDFSPANENDIDTLFDDDGRNKNEKDEKLMHCPYCCYFEIWTDHCGSNYEYISTSTFTGADDELLREEILRTDSYSNAFIGNDNDNNHLFTCKNEVCKRSICIFCNSDATRNPEIHRQCKLLSYFKSLIEKTIDRGMKSICPSCGTIGIKDDNCTHMACMRCSTSYCYCCGGLENRDLYPKTQNNKITNQIAKHNKNWNIDGNYKLQCPLYISEYAKIDPERYKHCKTDAELLQVFHRSKTLAYLQHIYYQYRLYTPITMEKYKLNDTKPGSSQSNSSIRGEIHNPNDIPLLQKDLEDESIPQFTVTMYEAICLQFPSIRSCGFTEKEIIQFSSKFSPAPNSESELDKEPEEDLATVERKIVSLDNNLSELPAYMNIYLYKNKLERKKTSLIRYTSLLSFDDINHDI